MHLAKNRCKDTMICNPLLLSMFVMRNMIQKKTVDKNPQNKFYVMWFCKRM